MAFLRAERLPASSAIVTSLPDVSELALGFDAWRTWFIDTAALACAQVADTSVAVFFQSDVLLDGCWIDKGHLVSQAAERAETRCVFHKIVCRAPPGKPIRLRPTYSHLQAFSRTLAADTGRDIADVLPRLGRMPWTHAMGVEACATVCHFLLQHTPCRTVVDPFCGVGTMLAVANDYGLDAIGVELSPKRAARARLLQIAARPAPRA